MFDWKTWYYLLWEILLEFRHSLQRELEKFTFALENRINELVSKPLHPEWRKQMAHFLLQWEGEGYRLTPRSLVILEWWVVAVSKKRGFWPPRQPPPVASYTIGPTDRDVPDVALAAEPAAKRQPSRAKAPETWPVPTGAEGEAVFGEPRPVSTQPVQPTAKQREKKTEVQSDPSAPISTRKPWIEFKGSPTLSNQGWRRWTTEGYMHVGYYFDVKQILTGSPNGSPFLHQDVKGYVDLEFPGPYGPVKQRREIKLGNRASLSSFVPDGDYGSFNDTGPDDTVAPRNYYVRFKAPRSAPTLNWQYIDGAIGYNDAPGSEFSVSSDWNQFPLRDPNWAEHTKITLNIVVRISQIDSRYLGASKSTKGVFDFKINSSITMDKLLNENPPPTRPPF